MIASAYIPSPGPEWRSWDFELFGLPLEIKAYALCILLGITLAWLITSRRLTRRGAAPGVATDIALWAVPSGIVGARIYHVATHPDDYFAGQEWWRMFAIWEGGIAIFGALIGGGVGVFIGCRIAGIRFSSFADALAPGLLVGQAVGRLGNWFNQELFGAPTPLPWGLQIAPGNPAIPAGAPDGTLFHPIFLYELLWNLAGAAVIVLIERRRPVRWGAAFGVYLIWYGLGRAVLEPMRLDASELIHGIRTNVWTALLAVLVGLVIVLVQRQRHRDDEPSTYVPGREPALAG